MPYLSLLVGRAHSLSTDGAAGHAYRREATCDGSAGAEGIIILVYSPEE